MTEEQIEQKSVVYTDSLKPSIGKFSDEEGYSWSQVSDAFIDGYHECQKEHEWHYVKDGDLPKENKLYFVAIKDNGCAIAYFKGLHWEIKFNLGDFGHCVETVIAWKEIVLPKEVE